MQSEACGSAPQYAGYAIRVLWALTPATFLLAARSQVAFDRNTTPYSNESEEVLGSLLLQKTNQLKEKLNETKNETLQKELEKTTQELESIKVFIYFNNLYL